METSRDSIGIEPLEEAIFEDPVEEFWKQERLQYSEDIFSFEDPVEEFWRQEELQFRKRLKRSPRFET